MKLIAECRHWWTLWSVRLAALAGVLAASIMASPQLLLGLIAFVPEGWRTPAAILTGVVTFIIPTLVRVAQQPKLQEKRDAEQR